VGHLVVDFAGVTEVVLNLVGVCFSAIDALFVFFYLVSEAVESSGFVLFIVFCRFEFVLISTFGFLRVSFFLYLVLELVLLQTDLGTKRLDILVGLLEDLHES